MSDRENVNEVFGSNWDSYEGSDKVSSTGGFFKLKDGEKATIRIASNPFRYYTFKLEGDKMPMMDKEAAELLDNRGIEDIVEDQTITVGERFAFVIYNRSANKPQIWSGISKTVFDQIAALNREAREDSSDVMQHDLTVTRTGEGTATKYAVSFALKSKDFTDQEQAACLNESVTKVVPHAQAM